MSRWRLELVGVALLAAATPLSAQTPAAPPVTGASRSINTATRGLGPAPAASLRLDPRPTLRIGDVLTMAVTARVQADVHAPDRTSDDVDFDVARRRIGRHRHGDVGTSSSKSSASSTRASGATCS